MNALPFLKSLTQTKLVSEEKLRDVWQRCGKDSSVNRLVDALHAEGALTKYQIQRVLAGRERQLVIGQYHVLEEIGRGGFGRVYKARHAIMGRVVALKVVAPELAANERLRTWFRREVLAATQFFHPNIVMAYDANEVEGHLFLVLEYVDGPDLDKLVSQRGPLPVGLACGVFRQAALGLQHAHEKGVVHRDIKPANLLVPRTALAGEIATGEGALVKVVDFGLARLHHEAQGNTLHGHRDNAVVGTPNFISPEQARDVHNVDIRSDLYSLGCTFYFALTGQAPFRGGNVVETIYKHLNEKAPPLSDVRGDIPEVVQAIVRRLMNKSPLDRYQTPAELVADLERLPSDLPTEWLEPNGHREADAMDGTALVADLAFDALRSRFPECRVSVDVECAATPVPRAGESNSDTLRETPPPALSAPRPPSCSMVAAIPVPVDVLRDLWARWLGYVERAARRRAHREDREAEYRAMHETLLGGLRASEPPALRSAATIVEPWVTLASLWNSDGHTLAGVLGSAASASRELGIRRKGRWNALIVLLLLIGWAAVLAAFVPGLASQYQRYAHVSSFLRGNAATIAMLASPGVIIASVGAICRRERL